MTTDTPIGGPIHTETGETPSFLHPGQFSFLSEHPVDQALGWARRLRGYHHASRSHGMSGLEHAHVSLYSGGLATPEEEGVR